LGQSLYVKKINANRLGRIVSTRVRKDVVGHERMQPVMRECTDYKWRRNIKGQNSRNTYNHKGK